MTNHVAILVGENVDITADDLRRLVEIVAAENTSLGAGSDDQVQRIETTLDTALMEAEKRCSKCGHAHDHEWCLCHNCGWDSAR